MMTPNDLVDRIERAYAAARAANLTVVRLELSRAECDELGRLYGVLDGIRLYRGHPVKVGAQMQWITDWLSSASQGHIRRHPVVECLSHSYEATVSGSLSAVRPM